MWSLHPAEKQGFQKQKWKAKFIQLQAQNKDSKLKGTIIILFPSKETLKRFFFLLTIWTVSMHDLSGERKVARIKKLESRNVPEYKAQNHATSLCLYGLDTSLSDLSQVVWLFPNYQWMMPIYYLKVARSTVSLSL